MRNKKISFAKILSAFLLLLIVFTTCACKNSGAAAVSGTELQTLRGQYPYAKKAELVAETSVKDIAAFNNKEFAAFVSVTITGEPREETTSASPAAGMAAVKTVTYYIPAHVDSVLFQSSLFGGQSDITLRIRGALDGENLGCYASGKKIVTMLTVPDAELKAAAGEYFSATSTSFYQAENRILLAMSEQHPAINQYSGWTVDAFCQAVKGLFA